MKRWILALLAAWICAVGLQGADVKSPRVTAVEPDSGKVGEITTIKGENLDKDVVTDFYLTDGKNDVKVEITERTAESVKFKVPQIKAGRYRIMTASKAAMVEQPVVFEVHEP